MQLFYTSFKIFLYLYCRHSVSIHLSNLSAILGHRKFVYLLCSLYDCVMAYFAMCFLAHVKSNLIILLKHSKTLGQMVHHLFHSEQHPSYRGHSLNIIPVTLIDCLPKVIWGLISIIYLLRRNRPSVLRKKCA